MCKEEAIIKILSKVMSDQPGIDQANLRCTLELILNDYDMRPAERGLVVAANIRDRIVLYIASKKLDGLSMLTLKGYAQHLKRFAMFMPKNVEDITAMEIRLFLSEFSRGRDLKPATIQTEISILRSFFGWLENQDYINKSPMRKINQIKAEKRIVKSLTVEEFELLREGCEDPRERALLETFYATGCRISEVSGMNKDDIDWQNMSARVIGKGNKERIVYFSFKAFYHLKKYLNSRTDECEALFVTERQPHSRLGNRAIQRSFKQIAARTNLKKNIHPHIMRHTFATLALDNGANLADVQALLGHEDPATTQIYATVTEQRKQEAYRKHHAQ
jgi:integrase/recombinase XerD